MVEASAWIDTGATDPWEVFQYEPVLDKDCFSIDLDLSEVLYDPFPYQPHHFSLPPPQPTIAATPLPAFLATTVAPTQRTNASSPLPTTATMTTPAKKPQPDATFLESVHALEVPGQCLKQHCTNTIGYRGFCKDHGGTRKCRMVGCPKGSQGRNLCIAHGGGKRCKVENCPKSAQSHGLCKGHGGGARCTFLNCNKSSQGGGFCRKHGGGKRCEMSKCKNSAQRGNFCAKHGGSKACQAENCTRTDRGGGYCELHRHYKVLRLTKKLQEEMAAL